MKSVEQRKIDLHKAPIRRSWRRVFAITGIVLAWFAIGEAFTWYWYASHESKMTMNKIPDGNELLARFKTAVESRGGYQLQDKDIGEGAMDMLKCVYGRTLYWSDGYGPSAVTVLEWGERSYVGGVENLHNPGICLRSAGWTVGESKSLGVQRYGGATCETTEWEVQQGAVSMKAFSAVFRRFAEAEKVDSKLDEYWNSTRLRSVLSGRRDAPILIVLGYFSETDDPFATSAGARFGQIMQAVLGNSETSASLR
jgi:hypothetical protein